MMNGSSATPKFPIPTTIRVYNYTNLHLQRTLDADDELGRLEKEVQNLEDELQSTESRLAEWNGRLEKVYYYYHL